MEKNALALLIRENQADGACIRRALGTEGRFKIQCVERVPTALARIAGGGVEVVFDPVGGSLFTDSLRSLREGGRLIVVGFAGGSIPEVKVNRLLLGNTEIIGAGWGGYAMSRPEVNVEIGAAINGLIEQGSVRPIVGERFPLEQAADALRAIEERRARGKIILDVR